MSVLFGLLMNVLADLFTKAFLHAAFKISITVAFIGLMVAAIYAYVKAYTVIVNGIGQTVPEIVNGVWGWVMPTNVDACLFAIFSSVILRFVTKQYFLFMNARFRAAISN
jgi:hypothetical protein